MNKTFFHGHDLMLSLFASYGVESKDGQFVELPFELNGMTSNSMFSVMNQSVGGDVYRYHKELLRFVFCLFENKSKQELKSSYHVMSSNIKDFGFILNDLNFNDLHVYFAENNERNKIKEYIIQGHYNCQVSKMISEMFLQEELAKKYLTIQKEIKQFLKLYDKTKAKKSLNQIFQSEKGFAIILTDLNEIIYEANYNGLEQINID